MYHLAGTEAAALVTWSLGTGLAAGLLASRPLTIAASGIAAAWLMLDGFDFWGGTPFPLGFPLLAAALWAVCLHGEPGRRLASKVGPLGFLAREIADEVPAILREMASEPTS